MDPRLPIVEIYLTCRLHGSLPQEAIRNISGMQRLLQREIARTTEPVEEVKLRHNKKLFAMLDRS